METVSTCMPGSSSSRTPDYFSFPLTEAEALDEYRLSDQIKDAKEEETKLRKAASEALKAANAKKKQIAYLEKRARMIDQRRRPQWHGVDLLTSAQQAEWKAHVQSGTVVTDEEFYRSKVAAVLLCADCAKKPEHANRPRYEIKHAEFIFMTCGDCDSRWRLKFAVIVSRDFVERKIAERTAKRAQKIAEAA